MHLLQSQVDEITENLQLATGPHDTYLTLYNASIIDQNGNVAMATNSSNATQVSNYTRDMTAPVLLSVTLDLNSEVVHLTFSETVNVTSLDATQITIQDQARRSSEGGAYTLTDGINSGLNSTSVSIELTLADTNRLKQLPYLVIDG